MKEEKKENIVKKVCRELGITQSKLAEDLGIKVSTVNSWVHQNVPDTVKKMLELYVENKNYKKLLKQIKKTQEDINKIDI